jgi:hypothetical protein
MQSDSSPADELHTLYAHGSDSKPNIACSFLVIENKTVKIEMLYYHWLLSIHFSLPQGPLY